jgi:hypothetical protein
MNFSQFIIIILLWRNTMGLFLFFIIFYKLMRWRANLYGRY